MVALNADVPFLRLREVRIDLELARLVLRLPLGAADLELGRLHAVEPVLDVVALRDNPRLVPLADRLHRVGRRCRELVHRAGEVIRALVVGRLDVVEQLIFRRAPVDGVVLFGAAIEDPAVAGFPDAPFQLELEVPEFLF